jgi:electron-transferring-flavoprotein dehydrogenase
LFFSVLLLIQLLYDEQGAVRGIATADQGIGKDGKAKATFQRGMELLAKQTVLAEGVRGSLSEQAMAKFNLRKDADPQTYALGLKEVWQIEPSKFQSGLVVHTMGWPLPSDTYVLFVFCLF